MKEITSEEARRKWDFDVESCRFAYNQAVREANTIIKKEMDAIKESRISITVIERTMREYGAIPTDWRHFWDDLRTENKKYNENNH